MTLSFKLIPNWKEVLKKAWSVRFLVASVIFGALELALPHMEADLAPTGFFGAISVIVQLAAGWARVMVQKGVTDVSQTPVDGK